MGLWSAYFLAKLVLYALGYMDFNPWMNLAFATFAALPPKNARQRFAKNLIAAPLGILLLYHDSWLPPIAQAAAQAQILRAFTASYLLELAGRLISWKFLLELAAMLAIYALARRKLRMSTFAFLGILGVMLVPHAQFWAVAAPSQAPGAATSTVSDGVNLGPAALNARLAQFYAEQRKIQIRFPRPSAEESPFDILILHVCSLSWDDLRTLQLAPDAFFGHFDVVLSNFNSAASYSGPAALRLLRGACGQTVEAKLYDPPADGCFVMDGLQNAGFEPHWAMNHDGHFGNFFADVRDRGGLAAAPEDNTGATPAQQAFDGTPVYSDYSVLSHWWAKRQANRAPRVALYYNTISLHDGNRVLGTDHPDSSYGARLARLSRDIARFMGEVRASGRRVILVFIAEHGAALGGDRRQIQGLREIPTAAIAQVPVAIALINTARPAPATQTKIDGPSSYPALNELLSRLIATNPFEKPVSSLDPYTVALPQADFVAENNGTTVVQVGTHYMMRSPDGAWSSLEGIDVAAR
ncbi:MAG TPA: cellulose biosynthesis protein BcsG [Steroidobacteraceae bacterium]|jgi:cellulose synthase operon protein YhjU|nr:cellulose biosynthesis protein BcsG [Steroidobacteraceae bacterium]